MLIAPGQGSGAPALPLRVRVLPAVPLRPGRIRAQGSEGGAAFGTDVP